MHTDSVCPHTSSIHANILARSGGNQCKTRNMFSYKISNSFVLQYRCSSNSLYKMKIFAKLRRHEKKCKKKNAIKLMLFKPLTLSTTLVLVLISKMGIYIINS